MNAPLVSIIIPVYNSERYLKECLDSVLRQTYQDLEIIAVNDGSTDHSEIIIHSYRDDKRLKMINTANYGVSHARNSGIDSLTGEYVAFIDSDDTIDADYIESLLNDMQNHHADVASCSYRRMTETGTESVGGSNRVFVMTQDEAIEKLLSGRLFMGGLCGKLYKTSLIADERLDESFRINEDVLMNFTLFTKAQIIVHHDICKYNYRDHISSATHQANSTKGREDEFRAAEIMLQKCQNKSYFQNAYHKYAVTMLNWYQSFIMTGHKNTNEAKTVRNRLKEEHICSHLSRRSEKVRCLLFVYFPGIAKYIYRMREKIRTNHLDPVQA